MEILIFMNRRTYIAIISLITKLIYKFDVIPTQIPIEFFMELNAWIAKSM